MEIWKITAVCENITNSIKNNGWITRYVYSRVRLAEGYALMSRSVARPRRRGDTTSGVRHGSAAYVVLPWSSVVAPLWVVVVGVDS